MIMAGWQARFCGPVRTQRRERIPAERVELSRLNFAWFMEKGIRGWMNGYAKWNGME